MRFKTLPTLEISTHGWTCIAAYYVEVGAQFKCSVSVLCLTVKITFWLALLFLKRLTWFLLLCLVDNRSGLLKMTWQKLTRVHVLSPIMHHNCQSTAGSTWNCGIQLPVCLVATHARSSRNCSSLHIYDLDESLKFNNLTRPHFVQITTWWKWLYVA